MKIIDKLIAELESYTQHISEDKRDEYRDCVETLALALDNLDCEMARYTDNPDCNNCENRNICPTRPVVIKAN